MFLFLYLSIYGTLGLIVDIYNRCYYTHITAIKTPKRFVEKKPWVWKHLQVIREQPANANHRPAWSGESLHWNSQEWDHNMEQTSVENLGQIRWQSMSKLFQKTLKLKFKVGLWERKINPKNGQPPTLLNFFQAEVHHKLAMQRFCSPGFTHSNINRTRSTGDYRNWRIPNVSKVAAQLMVVGSGQQEAFLLWCRIGLLYNGEYTRVGF